MVPPAIWCHPPSRLLYSAAHLLSFPKFLAAKRRQPSAGGLARRIGIPQHHTSPEGTTAGRGWDGGWHHLRIAREGDGGPLYEVFRAVAASDLEGFADFQDAGLAARFRDDSFGPGVGVLGDRRPGVVMRR